MPKRSLEDQPSSSSTLEVSHSAKYIQTSHPGRQHSSKYSITCALAPHTETIAFDSYEDFDIHYAKTHAHRCQECWKNFPTEHFLGLHIEENHDPLADAKRARGDKTFRCFVEGCDKVCIDTKKRRMHLTDKHMFPKNYDFHVVNAGIDQRNSMLKTKPLKSHSKGLRNIRKGEVEQSTEQHGSAQDENSLEETTQSQTPKAAGRAESSTAIVSQRPEHDIENLSFDLSALKFVPSSVRNGRGRIIGSDFASPSGTQARID